MSPDSPSHDLTATLDFGAGKVARFSGGADVGEFVGEFVRQKCFIALDAAFPDWRVYFRPDADGKRDEVVVEYGRGGAPVHLLTSYKATITKSGAPLYTYTVQRHWWCARWRWQSAPRPIVRSVATLKARGWIPNFGPDGMYGAPPNANAVSWAGPLSAPVDKVLGAFDVGMGAGGDNPQIGHATEYAADYIITGSAASLTSLRTEGEWCGNWSMHFRNDTTGGMLDVRTGYQAWVSAGGLIKDVPYSADPQWVAMEEAHMYPCATIPWMLTDDPYLLEELQFINNWVLLVNSNQRASNKLPGMVVKIQTRAFAWGLRDQFACALTTPVSTPSWLLPKSYWTACLADNKTVALQFVNSPALVCKVFRMWTRTDACASWMSAWLSTVVGTAVGQGFTDWKPIFDWSIEQQIRLNTEPGWRQWPTPYYWFADKASKVDDFATLPVGTSRDATTCKSWAEAWAYYKSGGNGQSDLNGHTLDDTGWDGTTLMGIKTGYSTAPGYALHNRAALATAVSNGIPGARACYDNFHAQLKTSIPNYYRGGAQARFSIDPTGVTAMAQMTIYKDAALTIQVIDGVPPAGSGAQVVALTAQLATANATIAALTAKINAAKTALA